MPSDDKAVFDRREALRRGAQVGLITTAVWVAPVIVSAPAAMAAAGSAPPPGGPEVPPGSPQRSVLLPDAPASGTPDSPSPPNIGIPQSALSPADIPPTSPDQGLGGAGLLALTGMPATLAEAGAGLVVLGGTLLAADHLMSPEVADGDPG